MPAADDATASTSRASRATTSYRLWIYTSTDDVPGSKGDVAVCLHGALGEVWLHNLEKMKPSSTHSKGLFQSGGSGGRCELYVSAQEVGTLQRVTVAYAHNDVKPDGSVTVFAPWRLQQVIVRHGGDGIVTCFPASVELKGPKALLELLPRLSWHEDMYGNCAERPPPPPPGARRSG
jgi:hypothetical protein